MTKKDYELIASVLASFTGYADMQRIEVVIKKMADKLASRNPRFNREKFLMACGVEEEEKICRQCRKKHDNALFESSMR